MGFQRLAYVFSKASHTVLLIAMARDAREGR